VTSDNKMHIEGRLWIAREASNVAGHGRIDLLQRIADTGSISQAAKSMGMSYKAAWDAVDAMNNLAGEALVERATGGKGGGGTRLTARGQRLVAAFRLIEEEHRRFLQSLGENIEDFADTYQLMRRLNMKTSARNQFYGKVAEVRSGAVNDEIVIELQGGDRIVSVITQESTRHLGLHPGAEVVALIKAPWVIIVDDAAGSIRMSAQNRLCGTIAKLARGAVNAEVVVQLKGGTTVCAVISNDSMDELALSEGKQVAAVFNASHVILGVPAY